MHKPVRVRIMGRDYTLRVDADHEPEMRIIAEYVDGRMRDFQRSHPEQSELTTAVISALSIAEELYAMRKTAEEAEQRLKASLETMDQDLERALEEEVAEPAAPAPVRKRKR